MTRALRLAIGLRRWSLEYKRQADARDAFARALQAQADRAYRDLSASDLLLYLAHFTGLSADDVVDALCSRITQEAS